MSKKLSFVLPCYNVERYIADCLDSIYAQGLTEDEFEVVCVNDCSTDGTRSIISEYEKKHSNLTLIDHLKNSGGCGVPRNTGFRNAIGDYICFVDADDMLPKNAMKSICYIAQEDNLDILLYNHIVLCNGTYYESKIKYSDSDVLSGGDYVEKCLNGNIGIFASAWSKLFNRTFLLRHSIWYTDLIMSEDPVFSWEAMICANRVKSIHDTGYIFRANDNSMTSSKKMRKLSVFYSVSILYPNALVTLLDRYRDNAPCVIRKAIVNEIKTEIGGFFKKYLSYGEEGRREIYSLILEKASPIRRLSKYMNRKQKIAFLSRKMGYGIFDTIVKKLFNN